MKRQTRRTVRLDPKEVRAAIRAYISENSDASGQPTESMIVFLVTDDHGRHANCSVEADWFEDT